MMRVIAGAKKGRVLAAVPGAATRPTTDKVKESIFNILGSPYYEGGVGLDLFAGTGALGIEALSRGMEKMIFIDHHPKAIQVIKENLSKLDLLQQSEVYKNDALRALKAIMKRQLSFNLILLDPPYASQKLHQILVSINDHKLLKKDGFIVVETAKNTPLPPQVGTISLWKQHQYGDIEIRLYKGE